MPSFDSSVLHGTASESAGHVGRPLCSWVPHAAPPAPKGRFRKCSGRLAGTETVLRRRSRLIHEKWAAGVNDDTLHADKQGHSSEKSKACFVRFSRSSRTLDLADVSTIVPATDLLRQSNSPSPGMLGPLSQTHSQCSTPRYCHRSVRDAARTSRSTHGLVGHRTAGSAGRDRAPLMLVTALLLIPQTLVVASAGPMAWPCHGR